MRCFLQFALSIQVHKDGNQNILCMRILPISHHEDNLRQANIVWYFSVQMTMFNTILHNLSFSLTHASENSHASEEFYIRTNGIRGHNGPVIIRASCSNGNEYYCPGRLAPGESNSIFALVNSHNFVCAYGGELWTLNAGK